MVCHMGYPKISFYDHFPSVIDTAALFYDTNQLNLKLKVSKSRKQILKFSFEPKTKENIFVFLS
jgi:hypothetical protein